MMRRIGRWIVAGAALALGQSAAAQGTDAKQAIIYGTVRNAAGVRVGGAEVWIDGHPLKVTANDSGEYRLDGVPTGRHKVMVRRVGFRADSKRVSVSEGDTKEVLFALEGLLEELDAVIVTAQKGAMGRMSDFWARRMVGIGVFITRAEIDRRHPPQTSDLFNGVMGVHVVSGFGPEPIRLTTGRQAITPFRGANTAASNICPMQYYVDGIFMAPGTFSINDIIPNQIEGIEVFRGPSEIPAKFRQRETGCGLVVLWTREPPPRPKDGA